MMDTHHADTDRCPDTKPIPTHLHAYPSIISPGEIKRDEWWLEKSERPVDCTIMADDRSGVPGICVANVSAKMDFNKF